MAKIDKMKAFIHCMREQYTVDEPGDIILNLRLKERMKEVYLEVFLPAGIRYQDNSIEVNVIGRGYVLLTELEHQFPGRCGIGHEAIVGEGSVKRNPNGSTTLRMKHLDIRPDNGIDIQVRIPDAALEKCGVYHIEVCGSGIVENKKAANRFENTGDEKITEKFQAGVSICAVNTISDFKRTVNRSATYDVSYDYQAATFRWTARKSAERINLLFSLDKGRSWNVIRTVEGDAHEVTVQNMVPDKEHWFCLEVIGGRYQGRSNIAKVYSGMYDIRKSGNVDGTESGAADDGGVGGRQNFAEVINGVITYLHSLGGGTVLFKDRDFYTTTIFLKSNVYLYIDRSARLIALPGCADEEDTWYSDEEYRNDMSHMSYGPYISPDNWMTKQDAGHSHWSNALFTGIRLDNVKIIGNGRIEGNGNLTKSNTVLDNESGYRADKLVALKLCTNFEMGGLVVNRDLWYEETDLPNQDEPFYLDDNGRKSTVGIDNMLHIRDGGHFVVLATGVDRICTHDIYVEKGSQVRDVFDYMSCNDVMAYNIYAEGAADDVIKLGSDCSLGFTRSARNCVVRNIIGDTACNLFQIGSETADDIQDVCIDNIYVLASDKAGFSISVNDGGHIKNVHLNCGGSLGCCKHGIRHGANRINIHSGCCFHRSVMRRIRNPFFISLSNRGRVLGGEAGVCQFTDDIGVLREELMVTNVQIGRVENIFISDVDIRDVYGASQAKSKTAGRWPRYQGQARTTALIVGYKIPDAVGVLLPNGKQEQAVENVLFENIELIVKGGNPKSDAINTPRELGVGQFNLRNLAEDDRGSKIPAYGYYVRHAEGVIFRDCSVKCEKEDGRYTVVFADVRNVIMENTWCCNPVQGNKEDWSIKYL